MTWPACLLPLLLSSSLASQPLHLPPDLAHQGLFFPPGLLGLPPHLTSRAADPEDDPQLEDILNLFLQYITPQGQNVSQVCQDASNQYLLGILNANPMALKMFDASAKLPPAGMVTSSITQHPGTFDSCLEVQSEELTGQHCLLTTYFRGPRDPMAGRAAGPAGRAAEPASTEDTARRYHLQQAMASKMLPQHLRHRSKEEPYPGAAAAAAGILGAGMVKLGRCVPSVCSPEDVAQGFHNFLESTGLVDMSPFMVVPLNCHAAEEEIPIEARDWAMIAVIAFFAVLVTVGTVVDSAVNILHLEGVFSDKTIQLLQGFSLYTNTLKLFHCPEPGKPGSLDCINGIRFISMTWVLLGHGYSNFAGPIFVNNLTDFFAADGPFAGAPAFAAVSNAFPSVDSFFLIGATLLSFITLKELDKTQGGGAMFWIMYFVHRYIRLTGLYAIVIGLHATLLKFFATGIQSYAVSASITPCQEYWWTNLLYINNLSGFDWMGCMGQTWYMANDMQFFLTSPFIIFALWKKPKLGLGLLGLLLTAFTAIPTVLGVLRDWPFSPMLTAGGADMGDYMADFYIVPWCRYQPYLVGLGLGYLLYRMKDQPKLKLNPIALTWVWAVAFAVGSAVVYGLVSYQPYVAEYPPNPDHLASTAERAIYGGFHRLAWSLALSWVILACVKGAGGPVNSILSWSLWVPLARMSYSIYLVHMTVMVVVQQYASYRVDISQVYIIYYLIFVLALCVALSYALVVLFEAPIVHLEKLLYYSLGMAKLPPVRRVKTD